MYEYERQPILVVDDTPANIGVLLSLLKEAGYRVSVAKNGESALTKAVEISPRVILLDVLMPGMDGFEVCERLKANPLTHDIPVLFLSALDGEIDKIRAFNVGGADYITKPFYAQEVLARICHQVSLRTSQLENIELNQKLKAQLKQTERALKEKESLLVEVHHRVKNNLQVVVSLLRLQQRHIEDASALDAFQECQRRILAMALVHERLYKVNNFAEVDFTDYIYTVTHELFQAYNISSSISLQIEVEHVFLELNTAIPCALIISELISNSLKYAFPNEQPGTITISLTGGGELPYTLVVKDNGIGLSGINCQQPKTYGLNLVKILTRQLNGNLAVQTACGTTFTITF
jgi:two-component sensor histidine kinase